MVEWKKIWEVTTWDKKFQGVDKSMQNKIIHYPYLLAKDLFALSVPNGNVKLLSTGAEEGWTTKEVAGKFLCKGEIVSIPWGKSPGAKNPVKYYNGYFVTGDNRIATSANKDVLNNRFLYYWLLNNSDLLETFYRGAGIQHPSMYMVLNMDVPIPSLSEQTRIVGILDTFTASIESLKEQIAQRRKQYEYYRDQLLDFEGKDGVEMITLSEIGKCYAGATPSTKIDLYWENGTIPWMSSGEVHQGIVTHTSSFITQAGYDNASTKMLPIGTIVIALAGQGKTRGSVAITAIELCTNQSLCGIVIVKNNIINKYVYYYLRTQYNNLRRISSGEGTRGGLNLKMVGSYPIPIPSISEQSRIVSILDTFEASISNLEAQLKEREKQYEYYRNKLLTFE